MFDDTPAFTAAGSSIIGDTPHAADSNVSITPLHARQIDFDGASSKTHGSEDSQPLSTMRNLVDDTPVDVTMEPEGTYSFSSTGEQKSVQL